MISTRNNGPVLSDRRDFGTICLGELAQSLDHAGAGQSGGRFRSLVQVRTHVCACECASVCAWVVVVVVVRHGKMNRGRKREGRRSNPLAGGDVVMVVIWW